jgi:cell division cycle 20-like protein 1 (cofactor of APC complex)
MLMFGNFSMKSKNILKTLEDTYKTNSNQNKKIINSTKLQKKYSETDYRKISKLPFKVLDAPNLQDDFYLNLLEWSSQNILSVALESSLYFWNANNNRVTRFCDLNPDTISSIHWHDAGDQLSIGTSKGTV